MSSEDAALLDITEVNQRVLLHRARSRCRNALEHHGDSLIGRRDERSGQTPTIRCVDFVEHVTEWEQGGLSEDVRSEVEEHLALCPDCVDYVQQLRATVSMLRGAMDEAPPPQARSRRWRSSSCAMARQLVAHVDREALYEPSSLESAFGREAGVEVGGRVRRSWPR